MKTFLETILANIIVLIITFIIGLIVFGLLSLLPLPIQVDVITMTLLLTGFMAMITFGISWLVWLES